MHAVDKALHQLKVAACIAASDFYRCQRLYIRAVMNTSRGHGAVTRQAFDEYLKAANAYQDALRDLWEALLDAAPFPRKEEEIQRTMARYEVVVSELHAIQRLALSW